MKLWGRMAKLRNRTFDITFTVWRFQVSLAFHGGGNLDIILTLWELLVSLKFHGCGTFDIIFHLSMEVEN